VVDSDEFMACELSEDDRRINVILRDERTADLDRFIAQWAAFNTKPRHRDLVQHEILLHAGPTDSSLWRATRKEARKVVKTVLRQLAAPERLA